MNKSRQKCCLHCPGTWVSSQLRREHTCLLPTYIKGNLKLSSLKQYEPGQAERQARLSSLDSKKPSSPQNSVNDRFAIAKKFHAENLEHQPLPDKVDDSVFKNIRPNRNILLSKSTPDLRKIGEFGTNLRNHKKSNALQYGPNLGCKVPTTNMDLAICWEAPIDPNYEPMWPTHIDGSEGGPAPAIFALVQHESEKEKIYKTPVERFEAKFINVKGRNPRDNEKCQTCEIGNDLCDDLNGFHISDEADNRLVKSATYGCSNPRKRQPVHLRSCAPCHCRGDRLKRPRCVHTTTLVQSHRNIKRNGLPNRVIVPRPRTPYAKRNFCIDTLTPPFNIVDGSRDADYPEHWRLTSVYQQSYRNPKNQ
uniref:DUF4812 domain-containing protein n=1 Tax=Bracon brevicornis TaxID=1563983 RepID=A0A6V7IST1_9HYME